MRGFGKADLQLAEQVIAEDVRIDGLRTDAEDKAFALLALQSPEGGAAARGAVGNSSPHSTA